MECIHTYVMYNKHIDANKKSSIKTHETPAGSIKYRYINNNRIAVTPDYQSKNIPSDIAHAIFNDCLNTSYHQIDNINKLRAVEIDITDEMLEMVRRKVSQYRSWGGRDTDKTEEEINWSKYIGHLSEYAILSITNDNIKMMQEINDNTSHNQFDFIHTGTGATYDAKIVNKQAKGSNHTFLKYNADKYISTVDTHRKLNNKDADFGIHGYVAAYDANGNEIYEVDHNKISSIKVVIETIVDYNTATKQLINEYGSIFDDPYLSVDKHEDGDDDGVTYLKRRWIYKNNHNFKPSSITDSS